jgi:hypothetical protein
MIQDLLVEKGYLENGQIIVPEFENTVENKPFLL